MSASRPPCAELFAPWLERWGLEPDGPPISTVGSSLLPARRSGAAAMLKVTREDEERQGARLMAWWGGAGAARVLAHDRDALLLERATGSRSLAEQARRGDDDGAIRILCEAVAALHRPRRGSPLRLTPLNAWFAPLIEGHARYGGLTAQAAEIAGGLLGERRDPVVLHGDVHHGNVLDFGARGWLAIDPKGLFGDRAFDYANLFRNPDLATATRPRERFARRTALVAEMSGIEPARIVGWTLAFAALSSVWLREDGEDAGDDLAVMELAAAHLAEV